MRSIITFVWITLAGAALLESQGGRSPRVDECAASGPQARITAQQLSETPPIYAFLVTNLARAAITGIVIGKQDRVRGVAPNVPVRMDSPPGWRGLHIFGEESPYMYYLWESQDKSTRIMPQQSATGFRITLPDAKKDPEQVSFGRLPFQVNLADGSCRSGLVGVDPMPK
jgi:hypothetical protein